MKNKFTYNLYYNNDSVNFEKIMEEVLLNYVKKIINGNNCRLGVIDV